MRTRDLAFAAGVLGLVAGAWLGLFRMRHAAIALGPAGCGSSAPAASTVEAGILQILGDTCQLVDPHGGLNPVVDVVCETVGGPKIQLRLQRPQWQALRAASLQDGGT